MTSGHAHYPHDVDGVADHIGGAVLALRSLGHGVSMPRGPKGREMDGDTNTASRYRHRAEEVRAVAETTKDPEARKLLMHIAQDYEHIARSLEAIAASDRSRAARKRL